MVPNFKEISILSKEMKCISIHCFALTESDIDNAPTAVCRNFAPLYSINEEAATGTSNCALACYLHNLGIRPQRYIFEQGHNLSSVSRIIVELKTAHVKSKVDLLFSAVSARFFSGENLCNSK